LQFVFIVLKLIFAKVFAVNYFFLEKIRNISLLLILLLFLLAQKSVFAQNERDFKNFCISPKEKAFADWINYLRKEYGKEKLPLSLSLSYVARTHITDLEQNHPDTSICNLSSWSNKGNWKPCCYNPYVVRRNCMWDKPKELTNYVYRGYELVAFFQDILKQDSLIALWGNSQDVLDMILTRAEWGKKSWRTMGVAINDHYVSVWFGQRADKAGQPKICKSTSSELANIPRNKLINRNATYYLIFGSYNRLKVAKEAVKRLNKNGFDDAGILKKNKYIRTYLNKFQSLKEALAAKQNLPYIYREAWILKH